MNLGKTFNSGPINSAYCFIHYWLYKGIFTQVLSFNMFSSFSIFCYFCSITAKNFTSDFQSQVTLQIQVNDNVLIL